MSASKPKVMVLIQESLFGGGTRQSFYILNALAQQGLPAVLVSNAKDTFLGQQIEKQQLPVKTYYTQLLKRPIHPVFDFLFFFFLVGVILKERPHAIVSAGVKLKCFGSVAGWLCGVPQRVVIVRGQGAEANTPGIQIIYAIERFLGWLKTRFITVCEYNRSEMIANNLVPANQVRTVHNGTDIRFVQQGQAGVFLPQLGIPKTAFVVGMVGRLFKQKRFDLFIQFMAQLCTQHPDIYGVLIGDGEDRASLQAQINQTGFADRILIAGYCPHMPDVYADLDLSVLFTRYEGCANALLESTAAGLPMIADDTCGNPEIVRHGENGYVVKAGEVDQAVAYALALYQDAALRKQFSKNGQKIALQYFDQQKQVQKIITLLQNWEAPLEQPDLQAVSR